MLGDCTLSLRGREHRIPGAGERNEERVALRIDLTAAVLLEHLPQEPLVIGDELGVPIAKLAQETGRAFDVAEQEGDSAGRKLGHLAVELKSFSQLFQHRVPALELDLSRCRQGTELRLLAAVPQRARIETESRGEHKRAG